MKIKELDKTVNLAWSPAGQSSIMLAAGTAAQQLDASFSTSATLDIYGLNLEEPGLDLELKSSIQSQNRFHKLVWGSCAGGVIVGGCDNGRLQMYNSGRVLAGDDGLLCAPERHTGHVKAIDFNSFQTNLLSSGASDSEIFIWDLNNVKTPMTPGAKSQPAEEVMCLAWNKQVQHILASAFATRCVVWDLRKNEPIIKLSDSNSRVRWKDVAWHPDIATQLCLASEEDSNPVIQLWDLRFATTPIKTFEGHQKGVLSIAWCAQDPELLVSCGKDSRILCWNPAAAQQGDEIVCELVTSNQWNFEVTWCPRNPSLIATSSFDGHASVFTLVGGQQQMQTTNKIADSFPGMDQFAEAPVVQPPQHSHVAVELRKAPKWLKRPVGASFGFGGKLVTFSGAEGGAVHVSQVVTEPTLLERSCRLQQLLSCGQLKDICHSKSDPVWSFVAASLEPDCRTAMRTLLGFTQEQLELNKYIGQPVNAKLGDIDGAEDFSVLSQDGSDDEVRLMNNSSSGLDSFNIVQKNVNQFNSFSKSEENSSEKKSPFKIKIGEDKEGVICRALLAGNLELAVDLCVQEGRMTDAIILAHTAGPDILAATQYKYFQQNQNYLSQLLSAVVTKDWTQVVSACDLSSWAEALAAILTYASDDQLPHLAERLGDRLEREGGADSRRNSEICFVAAGQLGHLIQNRIASDLSTEALQELVEMVLVAKRGNIQDSGTAHLVDRYAQLLAAQGEFNTALAYLSTSQEEEIEELRERLYVASGQKPYPVPTTQRTQQNSYYQNTAPSGYANSYGKQMSQTKQATPFNQPSTCFPPANQQTRSSSIPSITPPRKPSISNPLIQNTVPSSSANYTPSSMFPTQPQAPPANFSTSSAFAPPSTQKPFQPPPTSRTPVHFNSEPPPANAVPPSTFSHRSSPSPSLAGGRKYVVDPSVAGAGAGYGRTSATFNSNPYSQPSQPFNPPPSQIFNPPPSQSFNQTSSQSFNPPNSQPFNPPPSQSFNAPPSQPFNPPPSQSFNAPPSQPFNPPPSQSFNQPNSQLFNPPLSQPYNPQASQPFNPPPSQPFNSQSYNSQSSDMFNPPGAPPPMFNHPEPKLPQQFVPQTSAAPGWNDPPTLTASKRAQPKEVHQPPPITHPLFATAPQDVPLQGPPPPMQGMGMQPPSMDGVPQQQGYGYPPAPAPVMAAQPPAPVAKVAEPPRPKPPLPEEHMYLQTVFEELRNRCTCAANNPQLKRKLEDVARKLEVLYDALRENKMSSTTVGSLHQLVQMVQNGDYTGALHLHTQLVSGPDFSQISSFMPGLKVLIQSALQLGVYLQ
ncbi:protein transport protein Sec31A-like [Macrosteles quadrilineatus]|uniref:protein transport protein Sec31A-like n=1 Tax=Macrosteles quadrilineatus TaxID=74068 RepID=UPI0023E1AB75|nr:protein transport protein Sec31A-like [Macrosteles quadrilineatus]